MERDLLHRELVALELETPEPTTKKKQHLLFVAGYDYEHKTAYYKSYCENRIKRILKANKGSEIDNNWKFTLFDVGKGLQQEYQIVNKRRQWVTVKNFTAVTAANYTGKVFTKNPTGVISITDVYNFIIELGKNEPGTLEEFNIFSHAWAGGPILVNSSEKPPFDNPLNNKRDPDDKDARWKDFEPENMPNIKLFQAAFSSTGKSWIWGCLFAKSPHLVLHQLFKNKHFSFSKSQDSDMFSFSFSRKDADKIYPIDNVFFPNISANTLKFNRSLAAIKAFLKSRIESSYCHTLAGASKRICMGGFPGTYSEPEIGQKWPLWVIGKQKPPYSSNFKSRIRFYTNMMGLLEDSEKRGYGIYKP